MDIGLLIPALGGYWFLTKTDVTRYGVARQSGYHLFFNSAFAGFIFYVLGWLLAILMRTWFSDLGAWLDAGNAPFPHFDAVLISLLLAFGLSGVLNSATKPKDVQKEILEMDMKAHGQLIKNLLRQAMQAGSLIELSMRNGKTYIGYVTDQGGFTENDGDIGLIPALSGFRDNETRELVITTNYSPIINQCGKLDGEFPHLSRNQLKVLLPNREIVSARHFDLKVAAHFEHLSDIPAGQMPSSSRNDPAYSAN